MVLAGDIRQRFLSAVTFTLDFSRLTNLAPDLKEKLAAFEGSLLCLPMPGTPPQDAQIRMFLTELDRQNRERPAGSWPLVSTLRWDFPYLGGQDGNTPPAGDPFPSPSFFNYQGSRISVDATGKDGLRPYRHINLYARRLYTQLDLERCGILDRKRGLLRLRGITAVDGPVEIGLPDGKPVRIEGQGVLISEEGGFRIRSGITKDGPDDLCILVSKKGPITIETSEEIQASLVAINDTCTGAVLPQRPMHLNGSLAVDRLETDSWAKSRDHLLRYDPALRPDRSIYQIALSPISIFRQFSEDEP
jgi:hypothetical protein